MYEHYTRQSLPPKEYRELLGSAICVFNSNNAFVIENILRNSADEFSWYKLIDMTSGNFVQLIKEKLRDDKCDDIANKFNEIVKKRNRIIHSFQITTDDGKQMLATKDRENNQCKITEEFLLEFIQENEELSTMLHDYRGD